MFGDRVPTAVEKGEKREDDEEEDAKWEGEDAKIDDDGGDIVEPVGPKQNIGAGGQVVEESIVEQTDIKSERQKQETIEVR